MGKSLRNSRLGGLGYYFNLTERPGPYGADPGDRRSDPQRRPRGDKRPRGAFLVVEGASFPYATFGAERCVKR